MKKVIRAFIINLGGFLVIEKYIDAFHLQPGLTTILLLAVIFTGVHFLIKPMVTALTGPLSFITFGVIDLLVDAAVLFVVANFLHLVTIDAWNFPGFTATSFTLEPMRLSVPAVIGVSVIILNLLRSSIMALCD